MLQQTSKGPATLALRSLLHLRGPLRRTRGGATTTEPTMACIRHSLGLPRLVVVCRQATQLPDTLGERDDHAGQLRRRSVGNPAKSAEHWS